MAINTSNDFTVSGIVTINGTINYDDVTFETGAVLEVTAASSMTANSVASSSGADITIRVVAPDGPAGPSGANGADGNRTPGMPGGMGVTGANGMDQPPAIFHFGDVKGNIIVQAGGGNGGHGGNGGNGGNGTVGGNGGDGGSGGNGGQGNTVIIYYESLSGSVQIQQVGGNGGAGGHGGVGGHGNPYGMPGRNGRAGMNGSAAVVKVIPVAN